jgi:superfamily II DNA helicase RecQ
VIYELITLREMKKGLYCLIVVSPELLSLDTHFDELWNHSPFTAHLEQVIFYKGHCVGQWGGTFLPEYASLYCVRFLIWKPVQFYVASATLPKVILGNVCNKLHLKPDRHVICQSNDHWNCHLVV